MYGHKRDTRPIPDFVQVWSHTHRQTPHTRTLSQHWSRGKDEDGSFLGSRTRTPSLHTGTEGPCGPGLGSTTRGGRPTQVKDVIIMVSPTEMADARDPLSLVDLECHPLIDPDPTSAPSMTWTVEGCGPHVGTLVEGMSPRSGDGK